MFKFAVAISFFNEEESIYEHLNYNIKISNRKS